MREQQWTKAVRIRRSTRAQELVPCYLETSDMGCDQASKLPIARDLHVLGRVSSSSFNCGKASAGRKCVTTLPESATRGREEIAALGEDSLGEEHGGALPLSGCDDPQPPKAHLSGTMVNKMVSP